LARETSRCFLSIPFSGEFPKVRLAIAEALRRNEIEPVMVEDLGASSRSLTELPQEHIRTAAFIIADVTGGNPFVIYEVGFAHAMQKPVLLITQDLDSVPGPLKSNYLLLVYELGDLGRLQTAVTSWVRRFISDSSKEG